MVTRVRIEAEGRSSQEVEEILHTAFEVLTQRAQEPERNRMFGERHLPEGRSHPGLADAQVGECVIERLARDTKGEAGHGAIFYRGRMVTHFARPSKAAKLDRHLDDSPHHEAPPQESEPKAKFPPLTEDMVVEAVRELRRTGWRGRMVLQASTALSRTAEEIVYAGEGNAPYPCPVVVEPALPPGGWLLVPVAAKGSRPVDKQTTNS